MEEKELISRALAGDNEAFATLLSLHEPKLMQHCISTLHDENTAKDVFQEASIKAFLHLGSFEGKSAFGTWMYRITHNLCMDYLRKNKEWVSDEIELVAPAEVNYEQLDTALETLSFKHRQVFELYYLKKIKQAEIAKLLRVSHGTVRSRLHYARKKLQKHIRE